MDTATAKVLKASRDSGNIKLRRVEYGGYRS